MSGGHFDYQQYKLGQMADQIDQVIFNNGSSQLDEYGDRVSHDLPPDIIEKFKISANLLREAEVYVQRVDWLLSCDDVEDCFRSRLASDLKNLNPYKIETNDD